MNKNIENVHTKIRKQTEKKDGRQNIIATTKHNFFFHLLLTAHFDVIRAGFQKITSQISQ